MTHEEMIERAERLEAYAAQCRGEGMGSGAEGAEDAEEAAQGWRRLAEAASLRADGRGGWIASTEHGEAAS